MEDILTNIDESETYTDKQIFTKIWTSPRKIFKFINDNGYDKYSTLLLTLSGISRAFDKASERHMGDSMSLWAIIGFCIVLGGLFGWISYYIYAALVNWTGGWLKAQGDTSSLLRMFSYAIIPSILALIFLIPEIAVYGDGMFRSDGDITSGGLLSNIFFYGSLFFETALGIWSIVLCVVGTAEVQKLSIGMSILNLLLPVLIIFVPLFLLVLISRGF